MKIKNVVKTIRCYSLLLFLGLPGTLHAGVGSSLSGPLNLTEGSTATLYAHIWEQGLPDRYWSETLGYVTYTSESLYSVSYTFYSGDGQYFNGSWSTYSYPLYYDVWFSHDFTYSNEGQYTPSFSAYVTTQDNYSYMYSEPYLVTTYYQCGSIFYPVTCSYQTTHYKTYPRSGTTYYNYGTSATSPQLNVAGPQLNVAAIPEPETYAMLLAGLGLLSFTAKRRKQSS